MFRKLVLFALILLLCLPVFSYSICDGQFSFNIPQALEIQSENFKETMDPLLEAIGNKDYDCVLQQKGLNTFEPNSLNQYCRILIRKTVDPNAKYLTNKVYRDIFKIMSSEEKEDFFEELFDFLVGGIVIKEIKDYGTCEIGGKLALFYDIVRESTTGKEDVLLSSYMIPCGETIFMMQVAYRVSEEKIFSSSIKQFFDSLVINIEEIDYLSEVQIPGTNKTFLWPEKTANWSITASDSSGTTRMAISNQLTERGYAISLGVASFNSSQFLYKSMYPEILLNQGYQNYMKTKMYGKKLIENRISGGIGSLKYSYISSSTGITAYGLGKYFFIDDYTLVMLEFEYIGEALGEIKSILNSFGIEF